MIKYINADTAMFFLKENAWMYDLSEVDEILDLLPAADVEEVRHGEWIRDDDLVDGDVWSKWSCSECGYVRTQGYEYTANGKKPCAKLCENCGAKMNEGTKEVRHES